MPKAEPIHRGMMTPRKMVQILRDYGHEDAADAFEVINLIGSARTGGSDEALFSREDLHFCQGEDCEYAAIDESELRHGLCESCRDTAGINRDNEAMRRRR
jgi:hypothetical protein